MFDDNRILKNKYNLKLGKYIDLIGDNKSNNTISDKDYTILLNLEK
jgi:hypothetical protein